MISHLILPIYHFEHFYGYNKKKFPDRLISSRICTWAIHKECVHTHTGWQNPVKVIPSKCDKDINEHGKNVTKSASHKFVLWD